MPNGLDSELVAYGLADQLRDHSLSRRGKRGTGGGYGVTSETKAEIAGGPGRRVTATFGEIVGEVFREIVCLRHHAALMRLAVADRIQGKPHSLTQLASQPLGIAPGGKGGVILQQLPGIGARLPRGDYGDRCGQGHDSEARAEEEQRVARGSTERALLRTLEWRTMRTRLQCRLSGGPWQAGVVAKLWK